MNQQSFIYKFLLSPQFRFRRYLALVVFFTVISINQVLYGYEEVMPLMADKVYWIIAGIILMYLISVYLILKIISKYSSSKKYTQLVLCIILVALFYTVVTSIPLAQYEDNYNLLSKSEVIDNLSAFVVYILCISGVIIPVFLKNWIISNQHLNKLKIKQELSHVEQFKEQINPPSFFKILGKSKDLVKTEPDKASMMLMKLGQLLRYQLYDCNREQVLLTAEISFLKNFMELEKLHSSNFNYTIKIEGNITGVFVSPSVLLPYVQCAISSLNNEEGNMLNIQLNSSIDSIRITIEVFGAGNNILLQKELLKVRERLNALYKNCYELIVTNDKSIRRTELILQLDKK